MFVFGCFICNLVVAQTENANTADSQASDEPQASRFTWMIENFSRLPNKKLYSDIFVVGGYKWYLTLQLGFTCV